MSEMNEQRLDDAAAYALGAMSELEATAFRRTLMADCDVSRAAESYARVGDALLASVAQVEVPDSLGQNVLAEARRELEAREILLSPRAAAENQRQPLTRRLLKPLAGVAAAAAIFAGAFVVGRDSVEQPVAPAPVSASIVGVDSDASGEVEMIGDGSRGAVVQIEGLDSDIGDETYQLWVVRGEEVSPSSVFDVTTDGRGNSVVDEDMTGVDAIMVTREPAGGSETARGPLVAKAEV